VAADRCRPTGSRISARSSTTGFTTDTDDPETITNEGNILTATERALKLTQVAATAAADKLGTDIVAYDVSEQLAITDVFLVVSASNERQVAAVVDGIEEKLRDRDAKPVRREGEREGRWVLLDYLDLVVHVQHVEERTFYALERLWHDCPRIDLDISELR
jgi:ribosome-associated protein